VHLESLGFPLIGDPVYRKKMPGIAKTLGLERQALHAFALGLEHPVTHQIMAWFQLPPADLMSLMEQLHLSPTDLPASAATIHSISNQN